MNPRNDTDIQFIADQRARQRIMNAVLEFVSSLLGVSSLLAALVIPTPPIGSNLYGVIWLIVVFFILLALLRNLFLHLVFAKMPRSSFLSLVYFGRRTNYFLIILGGAFFIIGLATANIPLADFAMGIVFIYASLYLIFSRPLTNEGEMKILFGLLTANFNDFESR